MKYQKYVRKLKIGNETYPIKRGYNKTVNMNKQKYFATRCRHKVKE